MHVIHPTFERNSLYTVTKFYRIIKIESKRVKICGSHLTYVGNDKTCTDCSQLDLFRAVKRLRYTRVVAYGSSLTK